MKIIIGILLPLFGTIIGSASIYFIKHDINIKVKKIIIAFSSGIMLSSAIWSLMIPAINESNNIVIPVLGFSIGIIFLLIVNKFHSNDNQLVVLSIILHNIPEGMAVGVAFANIVNNYMTYPMALILSIGIAIQNIPEGAIVSIPLYMQNYKKNKAFLIGCLSGVVEPIGALIAFLITSKIIILLPWILSLAAGTMIYVVIEDLLPDCQNKNLIIPFSIGFLLMIVLECLF